MKNKAANTAIKIMNKMKYFTLFVFRVNKNKVNYNTPARLNIRSTSSPCLAPIVYDSGDTGLYYS
jgi:hypothetical protein